MCGDERLRDDEWDGGDDDDDDVLVKRLDEDEWCWWIDRCGERERERFDE